MAVTKNSITIRQAIHDQLLLKEFFQTWQNWSWMGVFEACQYDCQLDWWESNSAWFWSNEYKRIMNYFVRYNNSLLYFCLYYTWNRGSHFDCLNTTIVYPTLMNALTVSGRPSSDTEGIPSVITDREWPALDIVMIICIYG